MSLSLNIDFRESASAEVRHVIRAMRPEGVNRVGARGVTSRLRSHFDFLQATRRNQLGGKPTNFYRGCRDSTHIASATATRATIAISQIGFAQRLLGGTIKAGRSINPKTGRPTAFISIPLRAEAYGIRPASWPEDDLKFIRTGPDTGLLVEQDKTDISFTGRRRKNGTRKIVGVTRGGLALYALVRSVTQKPDPTLLPTTRQMAEAGAERVAEYVDALRKVKP